MVIIVINYSFEKSTNLNSHCTEESHIKSSSANHAHVRPHPFPFPLHLRPSSSNTSSVFNMNHLVFLIQDIFFFCEDPCSRSALSSPTCVADSCCDCRRRRLAMSLWSIQAIAVSTTSHGARCTRAHCAQQTMR